MLSARRLIGCWNAEDPGHRHERDSGCNLREGLFTTICYLLASEYANPQLNEIQPGEVLLPCPPEWCLMRANCCPRPLPLSPCSSVELL